ncbi:protein kinase domain-containing protein [Desulfonatronovibrio hydrogenovorans]|uniref:protein kinase domain-containing protein n=1 Tax=Desulfonatronovibrio hydrogenovorans TaxID=53245 RepID=UPI000490DAB4|nr:protein kinase [Desulfonatronovibrio hydrogenovorans]
MASFDDRRNWDRTHPSDWPVCVVQTNTLPASTDRCGDDLFLLYADLLNYSPGGALLQCPFHLPQGTDHIVSLPEKLGSSWIHHQARVAWTAAKGTEEHHMGVQFTGKAPEKTRKDYPSGIKSPSPSDLLFLMNLELFRSISRVSLSALLNALVKIRVSPGQRLITRGEPGDCLYLIQEGSFLVFVETREEAFQVIARLRPGDVVGEMSVLTGEPRTANVDAETQGVIWKLEKDQFNGLALTNPDLRMFLTEVMANRFDTSLFIGDRTVGKYILTRRIGKGSWGIVYLGMHRLLKMPAAIKMMKHDLAMEPHFLKIFRQEAETIARIRHQNVVCVYDIEEIYRTIFIIMEYLEGMPLREYLKKIGQLPVELCVKILLQICQGLSCAHSYSIVHRDIKPENIFLLENNQVKILDFGLACPSGTEDMSIAGTVFYSPPEQIQGSPVDHRSDLYSLGIMAYEMLIGARPYPEDDIAKLMDMHCHADIPDPCNLMPDIPCDLRNFILKCCRRDPDLRFQCAEEAGKMLQKLSCSLPDQPFKKIAPRSVTSLLISHSPEQKIALDELIRELGSKAAGMGISIHMTQFSDF